MNVVFRADASHELGAGHVMRCLTLAESLREQGADCCFVSRPLPAPLADLVGSQGHEWRALAASRSEHEDAAATAAVIDGNPDWLVVDHYALGREYESRLRTRARRILAIDDLADRDHDCDLLLDQNFYADSATRYAGRVPAQARTLLGPRFALVRAEFRAARAAAQVRDGRVRRLLIFFGGMDAADCTSAALAAVARLPAPPAVDVIIGAGHARREHITALCQAQGFALHVQTTRMAELMRDADLALGAGGSASWERCCVGLPALLVAVADNQRALVRDSELAGFAYAPGGQAFDADFFQRHLDELLSDPARVALMSKRALELVDGRGVQRVLRTMGVGPVRMRRATAADSRSIFEWRNHPEIRRVSRSDGIIEWPAHQAWFKDVLADAGRALLIGEVAGAATGVVRFDIAGDSADVSIYKVPGQTGPASGGDLLAAAEHWLAAEKPRVARLTATVLAGNEASHRLFNAAGYAYDGTRYSKRMSR